MSLYYTEDDRITTLCTLWTTPLVTMVRNSYAHARNHLRVLAALNSEAEILKIWKQPRDSQGSEQFATDSQGHIWMLDGDPRTEMFHQTRVTAGDTACNVNVV